MANITFVRQLQAQGKRVQVVARADGEPVASANLPLADLKGWEAGIWSSYGLDVADHIRSPGGLWL